MMISEGDFNVKIRLHGGHDDKYLLWKLRVETGGTSVSGFPAVEKYQQDILTCISSVKPTSRALQWPRSIARWTRTKGLAAIIAGSKQVRSAVRRKHRGVVYVMSQAKMRAIFGIA
jgi:hypothetical protein